MELLHSSMVDLIKSEIGNLLADSHDILKWWREHFCQLLNVYGLMMFNSQKSILANKQTNKQTN
jgi:hypothetical protein